MALVFITAIKGDYRFFGIMAGINIEQMLVTLTNNFTATAFFSNEFYLLTL